ncbi:hypothetical protein E2C01_020180 [Portunus trituberculatus]|uniref:Uncharacterized protein n=1 Tax=Portunus trituberculatus TaxID=210409 RepID=A0A5B7DZV1_PORTR|nr:hypothetical protein [Portunus trituberculatus]
MSEGIVSTRVAPLLSAAPRAASHRDMSLIAPRACLRSSSASLTTHNKGKSVPGAATALAREGTAKTHPESNSLRGLINYPLIRLAV